MLIIVIRTLLLYGTVILSLRVMGKRQIGELQPSELVVAIMISDLASVPMQAIDIPLLSGILPVLTLIVAEVCMSFASLKSKRVRRFLSGEPSIIIYNGQINEKELGRLRFNINDLLEELRMNSCHNIADVEVAVLETNGQLSIIPKSEARSVTVDDMNIKNPRRDGLPYILVSDGTINDNELKRYGKSREELIDYFQKKGINDISQIFLASLDVAGDLFLQMKGAQNSKGGTVNA